MDEIRQEIDKIDRQMAALYEQRLELIKQIGEYKFKNNVSIFDSVREKAVIEKNLAYLEYSENAIDYTEFLHFLMNQSKMIQKRLMAKA